jgi:hypothetical protein
MSVNSVRTGLLPFYGPLSGNNSRTAKSAALAKELPERAFTKADGSPVTSAEVEGAAQYASATSGDATDVGQFQSAFDRTLREGAATEERSTGTSTDAAGGGRPAPGIALYQRVSQYDANEPSTSTLLKSWNTIMQGGQDADGAVAAFAKALSQNETLGPESGVLDLTA